MLNGKFCKFFMFFSGNIWTIKIVKLLNDVFDYWWVLWLNPWKWLMDSIIKIVLANIFFTAWQEYQMRGKLFNKILYHLNCALISPKPIWDLKAN